jgi:hypothetical protein
MINLFRYAAILLVGSGMAIVAIGVAAHADQPFSIDDARFGTEIGTTTAFGSFVNSISTSHPPAEFRGNPGQSCLNLDLNTFLRRFDSHEMLAELRQSLLSGAQSAVSNYLIALAYSAPTLASVLDMTDRQLGLRFNAFAQLCGNQQLHALDPMSPEHRLSQASDQCFAREITRGTAPTEAYRLCNVTLTFSGPALPATLSTIDFLRTHTDIEVTPRVETLLAMLPDERIEAGHYQTRPPRTSLWSVSEALQTRTRTALDQLMKGASQVDVAECPPDPTSGNSVAPCLPAAGSTIVGSPAFRGARLLGPAAQSMFKDEMSRQIAAAAVYSDLLDFTLRVSQMNLRSDTDADAAEVQSRRNKLQSQVARLLDQANLEVKLQEIRSQAVRTQVLALEHAQMEMQGTADALKAEQEAPLFTAGGLLRLFQDRH